MSQVVVLNKSWMPIDVISTFDAVIKLYQNKALALDASYRLHNWDEWIDNWSEAAKLAQDVINGPNVSVPVPRVIVLKNYKGFIAKKPKCNRRNLFIRDKNTCQYCADNSGKITDYDIEHIIPKSRGGKTTWTNVVLSCRRCNQKKRNRTPEEAGMKLLRKPYQPKWSELKDGISHNKINSWHELLSEMYWCTELKEL